MYLLKIQRCLNNGMWNINTPKGTSLLTNVSVQPKVSFIAQQKFGLKNECDSSDAIHRATFQPGYQDPSVKSSKEYISTAPVVARNGPLLGSRDW